MQKAVKKFQETLEEKYPDKDITVGRPYYHPKREPQGIISIDSVDVVVLKSDSPFEDVEVFWAPHGASSTQAKEMGIDQASATKTFLEKMATGGRPTVDTSMWCK